MGIRLHKPVIVGASSDRIMTEVLLCRFLRPKVLQWVGPEEVTHWAKRWRLLEAIQLKERERGREGGKGKEERESRGRRGREEKEGGRWRGCEGERKDGKEGGRGR